MPSVHVKGVCSSCGAPNSCNAGVQGLLGDSLSSAVLSEWRMLQDAVLTCPFPEQGLEKPPGHGLQLGPKKPLQHFGSCKMKQILLLVIWNNPLFRAGQVEPELPCIYRGTISGRHQGWYQGWGLQRFLKEKKKRDLQEQGDGMKSVFWADWKRPDWAWPLHLGQTLPFQGCSSLAGTAQHIESVLFF